MLPYIIAIILFSNMARADMEEMKNLQWFPHATYEKVEWAVSSTNSSVVYIRDLKTGIKYKVVYYGIRSGYKTTIKSLNKITWYFDSVDDAIKWGRWK
jgi:hypothetical protein